MPRPLPFAGLAAGVFFFAFSLAIVRGQIPQGDVDFFESKIRPVLAQQCYECHSEAGKKKGGLLLDSREGWKAGGESGAAIVPGKPAESLIIQAIRHASDDLAMPKDGAKLSGKIIADFEQWIAMGAPDPRDHPPTKDELAKATEWNAILASRKQESWAFQPLLKTAGLKTEELKTADSRQAAKRIDSFIQAKLAEKKLAQSPPADPRTLIRRLSYLLTGLPPSVDDLKKWLPRTADSQTEDSRPEKKDASLLSSVWQSGVLKPGAWVADDVSRYADHLLASPRFGERWARHWMDWVRYAETYGSEGDPAIPYAWRYRDYLIRAFNDDVPYPQLIREAIAGDLLPQPRINSRLGANESALGIAQLRMVLHGFSPVDSLDEMVSFTDNQIDVVTKAFMGLTVTCARCHNHKFDPISQTDFYALFGIFTSTHPAVIDASAPGSGKTEREELAKLKAQIKEAVASAWLNAQLPAAASQPAKKSKPAETKAAILKQWDLRSEKWFADGPGVKQGAAKPGEFTIALSGEKLIADIRPAGVFSDLISTRDRGVLMSPRFKCEGGTLWFRTAGDGGARARYVVQNYPRTGTIHKAIDLKADGDARLAWRSLDLDYWKGDEIFIQLTTAADMPSDARLDDRSWFGVTDVIITQGKEPPPEPALGDPGSIHDCIAAWKAGTMTDAQALALSALLRESKLPNEAKSLPAAAALVDRYREIEKRLPLPVRAPGVLEADAADAPLFVRGDHKQPAEIVKRRFIEALDSSPYQPRNSGRLDLASSIADMRANPLTARVLVNRVWHHLFGRGIVPTTDNFGRLGEEPSHPELLDFLAARFIASGGSIKQIIKDIVMTEAFRQQSQRQPSPDDPDNKLLASFPVRRLEAEAIRDSMLALSGSLDPAMFGEPATGGSNRRSVYVSVIRNRLDDFLTAFDAPVPVTTKGRRDSTNVPAQSLALLNDPNVQKWAAEWGKRIAAADLKSDTDRVRHMFEDAFARQPAADEIAASLQFIKTISTAAADQEAQLASLRRRGENLRSEIARITGPVREKLAARRKGGAAAAAVVKPPEPFAEWDFEDGGQDLKGRLHLTLGKTARIENGALVLDGSSQSLAASSPLTRSLQEKTLEAWVQLDRLDQRGGGVMTVQDTKGEVFDSIVFGEKEPGCWVAGSDHFSRTQSLGGPIEADAASRPVHIAIVYFPSGKIAGYRDGQRYGREYDSTGPANFAAGESEIIFGCRHGKGGGNRMLAGKILRARLYDRILKDADIEASRHAEQAIVTDRDVHQALAEADRAKVQQLQSEQAQLLPQIHELEAQAGQARSPSRAWSDLALSIFNLKEFVYLK